MAQRVLMKTKKSSGLGETLRTIIYAVLIAFAVRTFAYEPFNIPSGSMIPTLLEGDYLFVSKFSYGYSHHTIAFGVPVFDGRLFGRTAEPGDVAVFKLPSDPSTDYIKRVVGLPGDSVQVVGGILHINGQPVAREPVRSYETTDRLGRIERGTIYRETLPNGRSYEIRELGDDLPLDNTDVYVVPEGHYFMMGDNRDRSQDSRVLSQVGYVPEENLVGRAEFIWFSLEQGSFWQFWRWPTELRWNRMFTGIH